MNQRRILDAAARSRRQKRQLEALEKDNFQDDPHANLNIIQSKMKIPAFNDTMDGQFTSYSVWIYLVQKFG